MHRPTAWSAGASEMLAVPYRARAMCALWVKDATRLQPRDLEIGGVGHWGLGGKGLLRLQVV